MRILRDTRFNLVCNSATLEFNFFFYFLSKRNKKIGDLEDEIDNVASHDSDQMSTSINEMSTTKGVSSASLDLHNGIKMPEENCIMNEFPTENVESKNIHVKHTYVFKSWCHRYQVIRYQEYFGKNDSQQASIITNDTRNHNDTSSSDINPDEDTSSGNLIEDDQSAIRFHLERYCIFKNFYVSQPKLCNV